MNYIRLTHNKVGRLLILSAIGLLNALIPQVSFAQLHGFTVLKSDTPAVVHVGDSVTAVWRVRNEDQAGGGIGDSIIITNVYNIVQYPSPCSFATNVIPMNTIPGAQNHTVTNSIFGTTFTVFGVKLNVNGDQFFVTNTFPVLDCNGTYTFLPDLAVAQGIDTRDRTDGNPLVSLNSNPAGVTVLRPCIACVKTCTNGIGENGAITFGGTITNCGNVGFTNVFVSNNQPNNNTPVLGPISLGVGQSVTYSGSYVPLDPCVPTLDIITVRGTEVNAGQPLVLSVTNTCVATCSNVLSPSFTLSKLCLTNPVPFGSNVFIFGSFTNTGNVTLTNVIINNNQPVNPTRLVGPITLAPGQFTNFVRSYTPVNPCAPFPDTLTATANTICGIALAPLTASTTCNNTPPAPRLHVVKNCPATNGLPGGVIGFSGTITNIGNVLLTNIIIINNQPIANTPVVIIQSLAPGEGRTFSGVEPVPFNACSLTNELTITARDFCNNLITTNATAVCPILTTPRLALTKACPLTNPVPGTLLFYSGTVSNTGNVAITNIVLSDSIFGTNTSAPIPAVIQRLEPGFAASFTGSYLVPTNVCSIIDTIVATGTDVCGRAVTTNVSRECPITTTPRLRLTKVCPANPPQAGQTLTYTGTITNIGNVAITNISLTDAIFGTNTSAPTPSLILRLEPGQGATFTGSYPVPTNVCSIIDTVTATGIDVCGVNVTTNVSANCPIGTAPRLALTKLCPPTNAAPGTLLIYTGTLANIGNVNVTNITLSDSIFGTNTSAPTPSSVQLLTPGQVVNFTGSYLVPTNVCSITDTVTATGTDACGNAVTTNVSATCPILTTPRLAMTKLCPAIAPAPGQLLTYTGTITNIGNVNITNIVLTDSIFGTNTTPPIPALIQILIPGQGATFTGSYLVPLSTCAGTSCSITDTVRATGTDVCGNPVSTNVSANCPITTTPSITVTKNCNPQVVGAGATVTFTGTVANNGNVALTNVTVVDTFLNNAVLAVIPCLNPGASAPFTTNYVTTEADCTRGVLTNTVIAAGTDVCNLNVTVRATNSCTFRVDCPKICIIKEVACFLGTNAPAALAIEPLEPGELCGPFSKLATGVQGDTQNPAFCYRITVTNCGSVSLTNVTVIDDRYGNLTTNFFPGGASTVFPANGSVTFIFKVELDGASLPNHISVITNTVVTTGRSSTSGSQVSATDKAVAQIIPAGIVCEQLYSVDNGPLTNCLRLDVSETHVVITYATIRNIGLADLLNVTITNNGANPCAINMGPFVLPAGQSQTIALCTNSAYTCSNNASTITVTASQYSVTNVAELCAHDIDGKQIVVRSECPGCIECTAPNACRVTGGGRQDDPLVYPANVRYVTHGGQVGAPVGERICEVTTNFFLGNPCIHGRWTHVRHQQGGLRGNFHARYYDTLECACLDISLTPTNVTVAGVNGAPNQSYVNLMYGPGTVVNGRCNPGDRVAGPEPRKAPANKIVFTGVGDWADPNGRRASRATLFRVDIEDRSEPGGSHPKGGTPPPDRYRIRIWVLSDSELAQLAGGAGDRYLLNFRNAISACIGIDVQDGATVANGVAAFGVRAPDIDDGGELERGNHQIHPSIKDCDPFNPTGPGLPNN